MYSKNESRIIISNDNYEVTYLDRFSSNVSIVFSSAGGVALAQPVEEFKKTITQFDTSYIFVRSVHLDWYNNRNAIKTFEQVAEFCKDFEKIYVLGESHGGSGALLFSEFCPNIYRILAFVPQYSALPSFCKWYGPLSVVDGVIKEFIFSDYSREEALSKSVLIFPAWSYEDALHGRFFKSDGFDVVFLKTHAHAMAAFLKLFESKNYLQQVMRAFYDSNFEFSAKNYLNLLHPLAERSFKPYVHWIGDRTAPHELFIKKPSYPLISQGKKATQSSFSEQFSQEKSPEKDAERVLNEPLTEKYNNHTGMEPAPWWQVDLGEIYHVRHIIIYNRGDEIDWAMRFLQFTIMVSENGHIWRTLYKKTNNEPVGGLYGKPFSLPCSIMARFVKIVLNAHNVLNLARVEIYGETVVSEVRGNDEVHFLRE
ncbi:discoidin domain-containing protein [Entomobacter blattae]|uniref:F5/8 type C domain protein n=1 Tax=Entomobacter blattae TaxID=2762277 RepID=A0A7H1NQB2_9PROT|nr:discoidin domain-containing protein [Entomobacter blattae]QNT77972.1 F5/8 type C domain protein [Entomobacter blattae]